MKNAWIIAGLCSLLSTPFYGQTKASITPPAVVSAIEGVTGKHFVPDTTFATLTDEDKTVLAKASAVNWSLPQGSGPMTYQNLVVGTRSYQLVVARQPRDEFPTAMLIRYTDPKAKPEPIARGQLKPKEKGK